ncbi:7581_t:CDS:2, partial [Dentiscutata erythropus]
EVEKLLKQENIKEFDFSQCKNCKIIARGGFSVVYSAIFHDESYALKCLNNGVGYDEKSFKLLIREIGLLHKVEHPNVIKFYGISRGGLREKTTTNTPSNYSNLYKQCWSSEPNQRPTLVTVLNELKKLQKTDIGSITHFINEHWIKLYGLNKGGNLNVNDFIPGTGIILGDDGYLNVEKISQSIPIIYFPKRNGMGTDHDIVHIHIPILTLHYQCNATTEFIQDIRDALNISDMIEKRKKLKEKLSYYGEYVVISATIGGVIVVKNWSKIDIVNKSRLKAYLQCGIDYAKGIRLRNFENTSIDDLNLFIDSKKIQTAGDLYEWIKDLHNAKCLEVVTYEKFKPTFKLLPDDLVQKISECSNIQHNDGSELISRIRSKYIKKNVLEWITSPELPLYLCDWIQDNSLQHGVILQRSKAGRAKKAAYKFLKEPKIISMNKISIILTQPKTRQEAYLLENGIILKEEDELELDKIPFTEHSSALNIPLEDFKNTKNQPSNAIYCQIIFHTKKISFDLLDIKCLQEFSNTVNSELQGLESSKNSVNSGLQSYESSKNAVNSELQSHTSSKNLCKLFGNDYGYLLPRTFTLGGSLSKKFVSNSNPTGITTQRLDLKYNDPDANTNQKIEQLLKAWNNEFKDIDTSFFLDNNGDIIHRNKIGDWLKTLEKLLDTKDLTKNEVKYEKQVKYSQLYGASRNDVVAIRLLQSG